MHEPVISYFSASLELLWLWFYLAVHKCVQLKAKHTLGCS